MITDFHSHILPGIDDGSASVEESIEMLKLEASQGIRHVIATPHFYANHDTPERFLARRDRAEAKLREAMAQYEGLPELSVGAEVYFFPGISDCDAIKALTIGKSRCILLEMLEYSWPESAYQQIEKIYTKQGLTPIIAHVDRYISPLRDRGIPGRLAKLPVAVQANASFFLRPSTARMALRMLRRGQIHVLGSDCHNLTTRRPNLSDAVQTIQRRLGEESLQRICKHEAELLGVE